MVVGLEKHFHNAPSSDANTVAWNQISSENQSGNIIKVNEHRIYGGPEGAASDPHLWIIDPLPDSATGMLRGFGIDQKGSPIEYVINPTPRD